MKIEERLTNRQFIREDYIIEDCENKVVESFKFTEDDYCSQTMPLYVHAPIYNRLAEYEDTGLSPEEIEQLKKQLENSVQLPCKVGDTVQALQPTELQLKFKDFVKREYGYDIVFVDDNDSRALSFEELFGDFIFEEADNG